MKKILALAAVLTITVIAHAFAAGLIETNFIDSNGEKIGTATLQTMGGGTMITVDLKLSEGTHAIHIHEKGLCGAPDFKTAGGHFNPGDMKHGFLNEDGMHAGDMPNLFVESTGHIKAQIFNSKLDLRDSDTLENGLAIVVHEGADDYVSDPAGAAGSRIACAAIKPN